MKIAFWSNAGEKCGVAENLAAISISCVNKYPFSVIAMENQLCENNLGRAYFGRSYVNLMNEAGTNYYDGRGMEGLIRKLYRGDYYHGMLEAYMREIISEHLYYIPQSRVINNEIFDFEFNHCIYKLLSMIEEFANLCFINVSNKHCLSTRTILEEADVIVVNLCQKQHILEDFFLNYSSLIPKAIFIISNYDSHLKLNLKKIAFTYHLTLENMTLIPINEAYQTAYAKGHAAEFIKNNFHCTKESPNYLFVQAVKKATQMIVKKAWKGDRQKEPIC